MKIADNLPQKEESGFDKFYDLKKTGLEKVLGPMHWLVGHSVVPFGVGGNVDMYYFAQHISGTGFATMELLSEDGAGPLPNCLGTYELLAFTRLSFNQDQQLPDAFNEIERRFCQIFTIMAEYAKDAVLNPGETCELPSDEGRNVCLIFDQYQPSDNKFLVGESEHHLLLCLEIFKSEMDYSRTNGSAALFNKLREAGHYPYSDMNREPVV
ncbi:MAG: hypothetical protein ACTHMC_05200 [Pseudobacter sp.]|uniref:hypothetical protein n=1 Tax=Pseudobacter sp. TaxID=2045420 RepID=UPI003F8146C9